MAKSRAEIQRAYRERKKAKDGEKYLEKERNRKRKYYVKTSNLTPKELKKRRKDTLKRVTKHLKSKKLPVQVLETSQPQTRSKGDAVGPLILSFPFQKHHGRSINVRKRFKTSLQKAYREIEKLKEENHSLKKNVKTKQKQVERLRSKRETSINDNNSKASGDPGTPRSRTNKLLEEGNFSVTQREMVKKDLLLANIIKDSQTQINNRLDQNKKSVKKTGYYGIFVSELVKKYRMASYISKATAMDRRSICQKAEQKPRKSIRSNYQNTVLEFLQREDNSTILPGKKDTIKDGNEKQQKVVLSDYLHNLYEKFRLENPDIKLSRSLFCRIRPPWILTVSYCSRSKCLCIRHQNFALKLKALKNQGAIISSNPDTLAESNIEDEDLQQIMDNLQREKITFSQWKKVEDGGKMRTKQVQIELSKTEFCAVFLNDYHEFSSHVTRVKNQYGEMRKLRENLPDGSVLVWMDFAENFMCSAVNEVQAAFWNAAMVTLHTQVVYFPSSFGKTHLSFVGVSEVLSHNATTVHAMLTKLIPKIKSEYPEIAKIRYLTDSPTSQYRNKTIFNLLCRHKDEFGVSATWDYLEAGHGKGPCDGLGVAVKRSADLAVRQGKAVIQNPKEFYEWAKNENGSVIKYFYVSNDDYSYSETRIAEVLEKSVSVQGTMRVHSVVPLTGDKIAVRDMSCHCADCSTDVLTSNCSGWKVEYVKRTTAREVQIDQNVVEEEETNEEEEETNEVERADQQSDNTPDFEYLSLEDVFKSEFVVAVYEDSWYIGQVQEKDAEDQEILLNFMESSKNAYRWPARRDEIWINVHNILRKLENPVPQGRTKRTFKFENLENIHALFDLWKNSAM